MTFKIIIADDHNLILTGLFDSIQCDPDLSIVAQAQNGIEAIAVIKLHKPDCAVIDFQMPGANGLEVLQEARKWSPQTRFLLLTGQIKPAALQNCITQGFDGIMFKDDAADTLLETIKNICSNQKTISPNAQKVLTTINSHPGLTIREAQILREISKGLSNAQIAKSLKISPKTVESHRMNIMKKLDVHSTASLLVRAFRDGLLDDRNDCP